MRRPPSRGDAPLSAGHLAMADGWISPSVISRRKGRDRDRGPERGGHARWLWHLAGARGQGGRGGTGAPHPMLELSGLQPAAGRRGGGRHGVAWALGWGWAEDSRPFNGGCRYFSVKLEAFGAMQLSNEASGWASTP